MDPNNFLTVLKVFGDFGTIGLVIFLWWNDNRRYSELMEQYKKDMASLLLKYKEDMDEQRQMYEKNVSLVNSYHSIACDLSQIVIMATQTMATLTTEVRNNQYCPMVRIGKAKLVRGAEG